MSAENVLATAIATLSGVDIESLLTQKEIRMMDTSTLRNFVSYMQYYRSNLASEAAGLAGVGTDIRSAGKEAIDAI